MFNSNDDLYVALKAIADDYAEKGDASVAKEITDAMYSGFTSSEVFNDILCALIPMKNEGIFKNTSHENEIDNIITEIQKALQK